MARRERLANNAETTLASSVVPADSTISVASAATFPTEGDFRIVIDNELMLVTAVTGTTFTVTRGIEGTSAANHNQGTALAQVLTEEGMKRFIIESFDPMAFERNPYRIQDTNGDLMTSSDFTLVNGTNATVTDNADGSISIEFLAPSATQRMPKLERDAPSTPYTIRHAVFASAASDTTTGKGPIVGGYFRDSANDEVLTIRWRPLDNGDLRLAVNYYTGGETFDSALFTNLRAEPSPAQITWFEMEDDGTDLTWRVSWDGVHFIEFHTEGRTNTLTAAPDKIGFYFINPESTELICHGHLVAWDGE